MFHLIYQISRRISTYHVEVNVSAPLNVAVVWKSIELPVHDAPMIYELVASQKSWPSTELVYSRKLGTAQLTAVTRKWSLVGKFLKEGLPSRQKIEPHVLLGVFSSTM